MTTQLFGIRHHGPGSARSLREALATYQPDILLVEGPPDGNGVISWVAHHEMTPPVALLVYRPPEKAPMRPEAVFYPFARFSPEWVALRYALMQPIPVRFMDLAVAHHFALAESEPDSTLPTDTLVLPRDPIAELAQAAGYADSERWWEMMVEQRVDATDLFEAITEAMTALRAGHTPSRHESLREAAMRRIVRQAEKEGYQRIAVVCGAWHTPALAHMPPVAQDNALLRGLPKVKVEATWVPWTYGRLTYTSGYGAGVPSPAWYDHLWEAPAHDSTVRWLTRAARLVRDAGVEVSSAHIIEATRLAEGVAALRGHPRPMLDDLLESVSATFGWEEDLPLKLVSAQLVVGERLGEVPEDTPMIPLQQEVRREQKRLRLVPEAVAKDIDLDLRKENDRAKSLLLHRLNLLGIPWGTVETKGGAKGTFHEWWRLQWLPEYTIAVIEASRWGTTLVGAATAAVQAQAETATALSVLTHLTQKTLHADLREAIPPVVDRLNTLAATTRDVFQLMAALPPLVTMIRYGNVRRTDSRMVAAVVAGMVPRMMIGLPGACMTLDEDAAQNVVPLLTETERAIALLEEASYTALWHKTIRALADQGATQPLLAGRAVRMLRDREVLSAGEVARRLGLAMSAGGEVARATQWLDGFLADSGQLLLHDPALFRMIDIWLIGLPDERFRAVLPLVRRTFARFPAPERRQLGQQVKQGALLPETRPFNHERGLQALAALKILIGATGGARDDDS
jgi:hypothetical protein